MMFDPARATLVPALMVRRGGLLALPVLFGAVLLLSGCSGRQATSARSGAHPPVVAAPARPWTEAPLTPGDWRYERSSARTAALFASAGDPPLVAIQCDLAQKRVRMLIRSARAGPVQLTATSGSRTYEGQPASGAPGSIMIGLQPRDPQLDALAFSRGRLRIAAPGRPDLILPARAEIGRVVEDCR